MKLTGLRVIDDILSIYAKQSKYKIHYIRYGNEIDMSTWDNLSIKEYPISLKKTKIK